MSSPKVLTAVMMASVKDEVLVQYDKKISGDDKEGLYDTAQQVQHALDSRSEATAEGHIGVEWIFGRAYVLCAFFF